MSRYEQLLKTTYDTTALKEPVQVAATALLRDTITLNYLAQIKLRNASEATVQKVTVVVVPFDSDKHKISDEITHHYTDLAAEPESYFASDEAIAFTDIKEMASFSVTVQNVTFSNGAEWTFGQDMDNVKTEKNKELLNEIHSELDRYNYENAIRMVDEIIDDDVVKLEKKNNIYKRCTEIAEDHLTKGNITSAERALKVVPVGFDRKSELESRLTVAKEDAFEKEQKAKRKKVRIAIIAGVVLALLIAGGIALNAHNKANALPFNVGDPYDTAVQYLKTEGTDFEDDYSTPSCTGWADYFGTGDPHSQYIALSTDYYDPDTLDTITIDVLAGYQDVVLEKLKRAFDYDPNAADEAYGKRTINAADATITIESGYEFKDTTKYNPGEAIIFITIKKK